MNWTDRVTIDKIETVEAMKDALFTMSVIMADPLVTAQRGYAYTDDDTDVLKAGQKALAQWSPRSSDTAQRLRNEELLETGGHAVSRADMMLRRQGFYDVMSEGNSTLEGDAWHRGQQRVVESAWNRYQNLTQHQRN